MIHEIILNLLSPNVSKLPISTFLEQTEITNEFFHPCEQKLLKEIIRCAEIHQNIKKFILTHTSQASRACTDADGNDFVLKGLYLQALADSLDLVLEPFRQRLYELEKLLLQNPNYSLSFFCMQIKGFESFFVFLQHFIHELTTQRHHGCAILILLHKHNFNGDPKIMQAIQIIRKSVYAVFLRQLSQWLIYGRLVDVHEEFFIIHGDGNQPKYGHSFGGMTTTTNQSGAIGGTATAGTISESTSVNSDLWQYQICYDKLPPNFTPSWAEKVLFIGQTVRMLNDDPRKANKKMSVWNDEDYKMEMGSLWNRQEHIYFNKIQALYNSDSINISAYERIVNEIKLYVTERLSEIAFNQADLIKHLKLVKDYYLLGRGELFLEFIIQTEYVTVGPDGINEQLARDVNRAFQTSLNRTFIDLEQMTMCMPLDDTELSSDFDADPQNFLQFIGLKFNVKWPLHLFFSPLILKRYNQLFRFLLQIRKIQNDLHCVWRSHRERKMAGNSMMCQLRNKLLFLIDNLQYYLQVDVLESQFSILINAVQNSKDFEFMQRSHSVFQANIMSLCFLLNTGISETANYLNATSMHARFSEPENPVLIILQKIMQTIRVFCNLSETCSDPLTQEEQQQLELSDGLFSNYVYELLKLLSNRKAGPTSEPLSQFLLRLDFNYWFSSHRNLN